MLDINLIREQTDAVRQALLKRMDNVDFSRLLEWDQERRTLITESETLKAKRNKTSREIAVLMREGKDVSTLRAEMKSVGDKISHLEHRLSIVEGNIRDFLLNLPNLPDEDVPAGGKENNQVVRVWGEKPRFDFEPRNHMELAETLGLVDYKRGAKLAGTGYHVYYGDGARLEWALLNYFIEAHIRDGYVFILPPHILNYDCGYTAGQFPKFADDVYLIKSDSECDALSFLLPTAETALVNYHREEILAEEELPKKYFAYTPCYRKEAGSYRATERGMIRCHQFNKVELFQFARPEDSPAALEELIRKAELLVQGLGLHHRVTKLAARDCSASMAKTYDLEVWIPSMQEYKEVSSASNARDFQARRGRIRFRRKNSKTTELVHTLNASGLATSRLLPALLEQFQRRDGSVVVPPVLRKWVEKELLVPCR